MMMTMMPCFLMAIGVAYLAVLTLFRLFAPAHAVYALSVSRATDWIALAIVTAAIGALVLM